MLNQMLRSCRYIAVRCLVLVMLFMSHFSVLDAREKTAVRIAVASNFAPTLRRIAAQFERETGQSILISVGSTGKLVTQIVHGAPFDIFLAADTKSSHVLAKHLTLSAERIKPYAIGKIVLWGPSNDLADKVKLRLYGDFNRLAMANPRLAPYGEAARQVLNNMGLTDTLKRRLVVGENIAQTLQFVSSGNADLGFIAQSQWKMLLANGKRQAPIGAVWEVPAEFYSPIYQAAVLLNQRSSVTAFYDYLNSKNAKQIIQNFGYDLP